MTQETTQKLVINKSLRDQLVRYLATKPYNEVAPIVPVLQQLESVDSFVLKNRDDLKMLHGEASEKGE